MPHGSMKVDASLAATLRRTSAPSTPGFGLAAPATPTVKGADHFPKLQYRAGPHIEPDVVVVITRSKEECSRKALRSYRQTQAVPVQPTFRVNATEPRYS